MSKTSTPILWLPARIAKHLPIVKAPEPIQTWSSTERVFTDEQQTDDSGTPLWRVQALLGMGWGGDLAPVEIRIASATRPDIAPNPSALMAFLGVDAPAAAPAQAMPQRRA